jgi:hypothetical protein
MVMGRRERNKGKVGEREVVRALLAAGIPARRLWEGQSMPGGQADGDIEISLPSLEVYAEVRRREKLALPAWIREVEEKAGDREKAVIFRRSQEPWYVAVPLDFFIRLLQDGGR